VNYDVDNGRYLEQLDTHCHGLEEVLIRLTNVESRVDQGTLVVELGQDASYDWIFCERPRLNPDEDWHREPAIDTQRTQGRTFSWRRFLYNMAFKASFDGNIDGTKHLIESDLCNVNAQNRSGETALFEAASNGHAEIVKLILQKDQSSIDIQTIVSKRTALMNGCGCGHAAVIELLIRSGANLDLKDKDNKTAFQLLDEVDDDDLSQEEKTRLKNLPRLIRQEQLKS